MAPHHRHAPGAVHVTPLHLHDERVSPHDLLVSREHFREARIGDVLELSSQAQPGGGSTVLLQVGAYLNSPAASVGANSTGSASGGAPTSPHPPAYKHVVQVGNGSDIHSRRVTDTARVASSSPLASPLHLMH